jgi:hypothetical protein
MATTPAASPMDTDGSVWIRKSRVHQNKYSELFIFVMEPKKVISVTEEETDCTEVERANVFRKCSNDQKKKTSGIFGTKKFVKKIRRKDSR